MVGPMQEIRRRKVWGLGLRLAAVGISYWRLKGHTPFRLRPGQAQLSNEVVGEIINLEHREMKGERLWVLLKADRDVKYSDGHHQLENVYLEVYPDRGDRPDKISARQTLTNEDNTQFLFTGDVQIETRDSLKVRAESVEYEVKTEVANITTPVSFERENIKGRSDAAHLDAKAKKLDLKGAVEITVSPEAGAAQPNGAQPAAIPKVNLRQPLTIKA